MNRRNPILDETLRGIVRGSQSHLDYLNYMLLQSLALLVWWPKSPLIQVLVTQNGPDTLLAVLLAVAVTVGYHQLRSGCEEVRLAGQNSLREWSIATPINLVRIAWGYLASVLAHVSLQLLLSLPLILIAYSVSGVQWVALLPCFAVILAQAVVFRLIGACTYLWIGQHPAGIYIATRTVLALVYLPLAFWAAALSPVAVLFHLLRAAQDIQLTGFELMFGGPVGPQAAVHFVVGCSVLSIGLLMLLYRQLGFERRRGLAPDATA